METVTELESRSFRQASAVETKEANNYDLLKAALNGKVPDLNRLSE